MKQQDREKFVDRLLDEALGPEGIDPRAGLEERIIAALRAVPERRARWSLIWGAVALSAVFAIAMLLGRWSEPRKATVPVEGRTAPAVSAEQQPLSPQPPIPRAKRARRTPPASTTVPVRAARVTPRQPVFAPARLTEAERALMAMLRSHPAEAKLVLERQDQTRQETAEYMEEAFKTQQ